MTPTAWKVIALSLAALLLVTVSVLIGTNLGSDDNKGAQLVPVTTARPATTTTASTTTSASTTVPAPTTTSASEAQRLGNRFAWCVDLQARWDKLDAEIAGMNPEVVLTAVADEVMRAVEQGEEPTGIAQVLADGSPRQPTEGLSGTAQASVTERAWVAFVDAASPETLEAVDALASAADEHNAAAADYQSISDAAIEDTEDSLAAYGAALAGALATFEASDKTDRDHDAYNAAVDAATAVREASREAAYAAIDAASLAADTATAEYMLTTVYTLVAAALDSEGTAAYRASFVESCS